MKVTFYSNFLNHHQLPFCLEMQKKLKDNFKFVATERIPEDRLELGYDDLNSKYDFVIKVYENEKKAYELALESDIVIIGSAPAKYIKERLKKNKVVFRYSERVYRPKITPHKFLGVFKNYTLLERKNVYLLCASAYSAYDYNMTGAYINKAYKWGYFPEIKEYDIKKLISKKNNSKTINIIWVARFLKLKHPEKVIEVAKRLKKSNIDFKINMIGIGQEHENIKSQIKDNKLEKNVFLLGAVNNKEVRKYMEEANIFLFTSDFNEGWGAVLNEAMNSGCAVVASHAIGSVPFLIDNGKNGLVYKDNDFESLYSNVLKLIYDRDYANYLGTNAYNTMVKYWNAKVAARELLKLSNYILKNKKNAFLAKYGPCSKSVPISNKKMYNYIINKEKE